MTIGGVLGGAFDAVGAVVECVREAARRVAARVDPLLRPPASAPPRSAAVPARSSETGTQALVEQAKYYLGPPDPAAPTGVQAPGVDREPGELPRAYGQDRITLLARDPWWLFAYWEVVPTTRVAVLRTLGAEAEAAREVLRVYDVTGVTAAGASTGAAEVELPPGTTQRYLNVTRPGASYVVEIGLRTATGRFVALAGSNPVTTPRASPSPDATVRWVELRRDGVALDAGAGTPAPDASHRAVPAPAPVLAAAGSSDALAPWPGR
jgi:hypothetical protein